MTELFGGVIMLEEGSGVIRDFCNRGKELPVCQCDDVNPPTWKAPPTDSRFLLAF